jgi:hypothetical protein
MGIAHPFPGKLDLQAGQVVERARHEARQVVERAREKRSWSTALILTFTGITSLIVLSRLPHEWPELGPLAALWVASFAALALLFGIGKTAAAVAVVIGAGAGLGVDYAWVLRDSVRIGGTVTCASHDNVVGVYVRGASGKGGWATWSPKAPKEYVATYSFSLDRHEKFRLGIGCGGSPQVWRVDLITSWVRPGTRNFVCRDRGLSGRVYHRCRLIS